MLQISSVTKRFQNNNALKDVSFNVDSGEIFALIGPNGSGKTTLTKIIAGLLQLSEGEVVVNGSDVSKSLKAAKAATAYIPDNPTAWGEMTGREFLDFTGVLYELSPQKRQQKIAELLPIFELEPIADTLFSQYSRGNRQKFTILAAFLHEPELILVDEPIVGLDQESVDTMKQLFVDFAADGGSVLITTHTLPIAEDIADRFGVLVDGVLKQTGSLSALKTAVDSNAKSLAGIYRDVLSNNHSENA